MRLVITKDENGENNTLEIKVDYDKGGWSYATCKEIPRGYYLSVQPLHVSGNIVSLTAFTGFRVRLEEAKRLNTKKLTAYNTDESITHLINSHSIKLWARQEGYDVKWSA